MMYLVLLAILAINLDPEVLDAFIRMKKDFQATSQVVNQGSIDFVAQMKSEIQREMEKEGKMTNEGLLDTLDQIRGKTMAFTQVINAHLEEMETLADWDEEKQEYTAKDESERNYQYWMGTDDMAEDRRGNGAAYDLRNTYDEYIRYLHGMYNSQVKGDSLQKELVLLPDPGRRSDPDERWEEYTFEGPVSANLATLEAMKADILRREKEVLDILNTRLGGRVFVVDKLVPIVVPTTQVVAAGLPFEAQLYVGMSSSAVKPQFSAGNGRISPLEGGSSARYQVIADGSRIPQGKTEGTQTYSATIRVPKADGTFEILNVNQQFTVRKPEVQIFSLAVQNLYRNCGNEVSIDVPALGEYYNPKVTASRATVRQSDRSIRRFVIIPTGRESMVTVMSETNGQLVKVDDIKYNVINPPKPEIFVKVDGRPFNGLNAVKATQRFALHVEADKEFKRLLPKDARYKVGQVKILLKDQLGPARPVRTINTSGQNPENGIRITLPQEVRQAGPGIKFFLQLEDVYRVNFRGQRVDLGLSDYELTVPFTLRR